MGRGYDCVWFEREGGYGRMGGVGIDSVGEVLFGSGGLFNLTLFD